LSVRVPGKGTRRKTGSEKGELLKRTTRKNPGATLRERYNIAVVWGGVLGCRKRKDTWGRTENFQDSSTKRERRKKERIR